MFCRHWSGLPKDVAFPSDLKSLGYFVNEQDEVRSIKNPDQYFNFFINKNERIKQRQRFEFDNALQDIVHERLQAEGVEKIALPLGTPTTQPHVPVFATTDLASKSRIVLFIGEPTQALGILAGRVANGPGGINKGSMVSVIQELQKRASSPTDPSPPGIFIANPGQLYWWPEGCRCLTVTASSAIPLPSLVHIGRRYIPEVNSVKGHEMPNDHVESVFSTLLGMIDGSTNVSLVAIGQSCEMVTQFLDNQENWNTWKDHLDSMLLLGTVYPADDLKNDNLRKFLARRTRAYITSPEPLDTPLAPPSGNEEEQIPSLGCPCYSSSEPFYIETILIRALTPALDYLERVALTPGYENDEVLVAERPMKEFTDEHWNTLSDSEKPFVGVVDEDAMTREMRIAKRWRKFRETGGDLGTDSSDDEDEA